MKVLLCNTTDISGGAARAAYRLLTGLKKAGVNARMLVMDKKSTDKSVLKVSDYHDDYNILERNIRKIIRKILVKIRNRKWNRYPNRLKVLSHDITFSGLNNTLSKIDIDILHLHWVEGDFINYKDLQNISKPIIWTIHGCFPFTGICHYFENCDRYKTQCGNCPILKSGIEKDFSSEMFLQKIKRYKPLDLHIVSPSKWLAERAKESALLGDRPIHVIPNGIDTERFKSVSKAIARKALRIDEHKKMILFGGVSAKTDERKGYLHLQKAMKVLEEHYESGDVELLIFGVSVLEEEDENYFTTTYLDYISNDRLLVLAYSAADVMVLPSKFENLPNTIMESLACGTPVAAFNIGGNPDMIDHKKNGYLAIPYEPKDLAEGIKWCLENNDDDLLSSNARRKVLDKFTLEAISKQYISLYKSLL